LFEQSNTYEIFQLGSEVVRDDSSFQKYKGILDMVFTSPPYFAKEAYSEDPTQSYKKFTGYDAWREGFLRPTLETAVEYLRNDRYLLWNIADAKFGADMLPLEKDSKDILESLGMQFKGVVKMALAQMPGGNRIDPDTGLPKAKNFCKVNGMWLKYEPIFVFYKP
jgi:DNA modification methylase